MNAKTMPSYSHEHVVHVINPHFQTLASDIRKLFRGLNIIDLVRGVRAYDQMHVLNPSYYVLFSSIEDSNRAVNAATHSIRNCSVIVEAAPDGAYKRMVTSVLSRFCVLMIVTVKEDNSGFVKRLERKLLAQREDMLEQSSQWPNKTVHQVESDASTPQCAVIPQFLASTATGFDNGAEHYRAGHYMRIQEHSYAPPLIRGIASEPAKNHYDKAPWVFGSHEERKHGYEIYLHNQNFARYMTRELDFRRRAAERQPVQFGAIGEPDTRTLEIQVNTAGTYGLAAVFGRR